MKHLQHDALLYVVYPGFDARKEKIFSTFFVEYNLYSSRIFA